MSHPSPHPPWFTPWFAPLFAGLALLALPLGGCYRVPPGKTAVDDVSVKVNGTKDVDGDDIEDKLATRASSRFLGLFPGVVFEYEIFDRFGLRRDLSRVERYMQARGYYDARVWAARVVQDGDKVRVTIEVDAGEPVRVESVEITGGEALSQATRDAIRDRVQADVSKGAAFDEDKFELAEKDATRVLTTQGYAAGKVHRRAEVDVGHHAARLFFTVEPGPIANFGPVKFVGLGNLSETIVRRTFDVDEGDLYSTDDLDAGRQALLDLGVFGAVDVDADTSAIETTHVVPVTVRLERAKIRAVLLGGGAEFDSFKTDGHVQVGWQNSDFLGGLRRLDARIRPGLVLYPTRLTVLEAPRKVLAEGRSSVSLHQPSFIERRTTGFLRAEYSIYPVLLPTPTENVLGYHEVRGAVGAERPIGRFFARAEYAAQANFPVDYIGTTPGVERLLVSDIILFTHYDLRDDPIHTRKGIFIANELQLAGGPLGGDATDIRTQPQIRGFIPLAKKIVLAMRGSVGFLFPFDYAMASQINFETPGPSRIEGASRDYQILYFRGFYGGGPSSNRGYPLRAIGPHDLIPYLSPAGQSTVAGGCNPSDPECLLPTGGLTLWEANAEVRFSIAGPFSTAVFCDAGDVSPLEVDIRLDHLHLSCGGGARYDTPVGPIRLDVGYRLPGLQYPAGSVGEVQPPPLFGAPIAVAFGIGEAF